LINAKNISPGGMAILPTTPIRKGK